MIVVADASPLNYLIQIDCVWILPKLYDRVAVPGSVIEELERNDAPVMVRNWVASLPSWIERVQVAFVDPDLSRLDPGEREAIQLFLDIKANLLLIDERKGRSEAARLGIRTTGTLGVLVAANRRRLIDAEEKYRLLISRTTFRTSKLLEQQFLMLIQ